MANEPLKIIAKRREFPAHGFAAQPLSSWVGGFQKRYPGLDIVVGNVLNFLGFAIHHEFFQIPGEIIRRVL